MTRRDFLKLTGKAAVASSAMLSGCAVVSPGSGSGAASAIDIHHHYFPPEPMDEIKTHGKTLGIEYFPPKTPKDNPLALRFGKGRRLNLDRRLADVNKRLEIKTRGQIGIATVEDQTSAVGYELTGEHGESWSKLYNEAIMSLVKRHPSRFAGIATVPLQDPPRAARVLEHAIRDLKMAGVTIPSNVVGKY